MGGMSTPPMSAGTRQPSPNYPPRRAMRILRPQPEPSPRPHAPAAPTAAGAGGALLRCRLRLANGRVFTGALPAARHRALQLGMLHADTAQLVELTPGTRSPDGKLELDRRARLEHYLPGGAGGSPVWLHALLEHAERIVAGDYAERRFDHQAREEAFVGVAPRVRPRGNKDAVPATRFLWIDVDQPGQLPALWAFLAERPSHLLIESGGSGGAHAYWKLDQPLTAAHADKATGELVDPIERAHLRIIHRLGVGDDGKPNVADVACKERARVMRVAGTINYKTGQYARIVEADFQLPGYPLEELVGDLPDPSPPAAPTRARRTIQHDDPYKRIPPPEYFQRLAGITVPRSGMVSCPVPGHDDAHPSCSVGVDASQGWCCLAAETRVITHDGVKPIAELAGTTQRVLSTGGVWVAAQFESFGAQRLWRISARRSGRQKEIFATPEHRWFVRTSSKHRPKRELATSDLRPGQRLVSVFPNRTPRVCKLNVSPFGVARGFTFGDGHRFRQGSRASFYGAKDAAVLPYFPLSKPYHHAPTGSLVVGDLPGYFKELPDLEELPSYLHGWLAGYLAADGDVSKTTVSLHCADGDVLERVRAICTRVGIGTYGISRYDRKGIRGVISAIYRLRLMRTDLIPEFFVLPHHRARFEAQDSPNERRDWIVTEIEPTARTEEVFCATVPGTHAFALEDNILTGNCHAASCGARGAIYDLASVLLGGPYGRELRGDAFARARARVCEEFGEQEFGEAAATRRNDGGAPTDRGPRR
jgi:LAGLIDADG-like domain